MSPAGLPFWGLGGRSSHGRGRESHGVASRRQRRNKVEPVGAGAVQGRGGSPVYTPLLSNSQDGSERERVPLNPPKFKRSLYGI